MTFRTTPETPVKFLQSLFLGLFLIGVVLPQAIIALSMQQMVNKRIAERVRVLRQVNRTITSADLDEARQGVMDDFDRIYETRRSIFRFKFTMKFALNVITGIGTVGILFVGGLLVFEDRTDIGTVVAALSALVRLSDPWRQLITFYRELSAVRVKFDILITS